MSKSAHYEAKSRNCNHAGASFIKLFSQPQFFFLTFKISLSFQSGHRRSLPLQGSRGNEGAASASPRHLIFLKEVPLGLNSCTLNGLGLIDLNWIHLNLTTGISEPRDFQLSLTDIIRMQCVNGIVAVTSDRTNYPPMFFSPDASYQLVVCTAKICEVDSKLQRTWKIFTITVKQAMQQLTSIMHMTKLQY